MTTAAELAALRAEVAAIRGEIAALARIARIAYEAGRDEAMGIPAAARKPPRRSRGKLKLVP